VKKLSGDASPSPPLEERVGERRPFSAANLNFFTASARLMNFFDTYFVFAIVETNLSKI